MSVVEMRGVRKRFGRVEALRGVNLDLEPGHIVGLLGANGAGKSTLIRHMVGLYLPDAGSCRTFGRDVADLGEAELARIGYVHQEGRLLEWMRVRQLIDFVAAHYPGWDRERERDFCVRFEIDERTRVLTLSPGQRQRLAILLAVCFGADLLLLDEPASGLDPLARAEFLRLLVEIVQDEGKTILVSSHILSDVEKVIDHVLVMDAGRMVCDCPLDVFQERYCRLRVVSHNGTPLPDRLPFAAIGEVRRTVREAEFVAVRPGAEQVGQAERELHADVSLSGLPLEDLYAAAIRQHREGRP